ncbi:MAG TPA: HAMP domain-containing sensor histidine kinase [Candidatus Nanoarchaeia archaeon]|nr:HAMP domain-containing sensor histidine kinase [Candidatus Nanoarchaeia archaeon]
MGQKKQLPSTILTTRDYESLYRTLLEKMDEGFCEIEMIYDKKGKPVDYRFLAINAAFMSQTGLTDALTKTMKEMVPNHDEHWFKIYGDVAKTGKSIRFENPAVAMKRFYDVFAFRIGENGSKRVGILFKDITESKQLESAKNLFLSMISHELRTPLTPIRSQLELMRDKFKLDEKQTEMLKIILRNVGRLNTIINDLLDVTRIEAGRLTVDKKKENLTVLLRDVVSFEAESASERGISLSVDVPKLPIVNIDKNRITQVIINLLNNSIKHSNAAKIKVEAEKKGKNIEIMIKDNGKGISKENASKLFTPFFVSQETTESGGAGLGVYICKGLIDLHGGKIWVESVEGKGTTFFISLPIK